MVLEDELKSSGLLVTFATNAVEGLYLAFSLNPDFIILELTFDDMTCIELINKLKERKKPRASLL